MVTYRHALSLISMYLCLIFFLITTSAAEDCDKTKCPGPLKYYKDLQCTPIYKKGNSCCAVRYNCDHLKNRSINKCYINGKEYKIGERLKKEDARPCDVGCTCAVGYSHVAQFLCAIVDCIRPTSVDCYLKGAFDQCCPGPEICPDKESNIAKCEVDGKTYYDGQYFVPASDPGKYCYCKKGYKGKNVEPFCKLEGSDSCRPEMRHADNIYKNCAPIYYSNQDPVTSCNVFFRCQNANDTVIPSSGTSGQSKGSNKKENQCKFGNLTMRIGDELNQATDYNSVCVKCVCEVPPTPTCHRLPDSECDVTVHPPFE